MTSGVLIQSIGSRTANSLPDAGAVGANGAAVHGNQARDNGQAETEAAVGARMQRNDRPPRAFSACAKPTSGSSSFRWLLDDVFVRRFVNRRRV
jgi:hypothetical protein